MPPAINRLLRPPLPPRDEAASSAGAAAPSPPSLPTRPGVCSAPPRAKLAGSTAAAGSAATCTCRAVGSRTLHQTRPTSDGTVPWALGLLESEARKRAWRCRRFCSAAIHGRASGPSSCSHREPCTQRRWCRHFALARAPEAAPPRLSGCRVAPALASQRASEAAAVAAKPSYRPSRPSRQALLLASLCAPCGFRSRTQCSKKALLINPSHPWPRPSHYAAAVLS